MRVLYTKFTFYLHFLNNEFFLMEIPENRKMYDSERKM